MASAGEIKWQVSKPVDPVPTGFMWKKVGDATTEFTTGGKIVTPKWMVVAKTALKPKKRFPVVFAVGVLMTVGVLWMLRGQ